MRLIHVLLLTAFGHRPITAGSLSAPPPPLGLNAREKSALPDREPFGFGAAATGGGVASANNTYVVDNMMDLRRVLKMDEPRTVYVRGEIRGSQINETFAGDCQYYVDSSSVPGFNLTLYVMALNATYTDAVKAAAAADETFEGRNATEYLALLNRQNGWRGTAQNVQKSWESIDARGNLTLIGTDSTAYLHGVSLIFNSRSNIIIRNLRLSSPRDCFPAPETYPATWNARYDAVSFVSTTTAWLDGNTFEDSAAGAVAPDDIHLWGWQVDRYDGLFDVEDGSDDITFSHNVVANHHKSLLWGGGEKEGSRDIGKMRFTVFGNRFVNSLSRNPLMRFGTFYVANNVFENYANRPPLYDKDDDGDDDDNNRTSGGPYTNSILEESREAAGERKRNEEDDEPYTPDFQYHLGIYNLSSVLVTGNYFAQTGPYASDVTRIFAFQNLATPLMPGYFCSPADLPFSFSSSSSSRYTRLQNTLNNTPLNLTATLFDSFTYHLRTSADSAPDGLVSDCARFGEAQDLPTSFDTAEDVYAYVVRNAGQDGGGGVER
ncbi:polysaccharide lyase family 1 protein [Xylaria acuta]|nr:polysaccharide lyase family 1 protein [Xylaria acuta]